MNKNQSTMFGAAVLCVGLLGAAGCQSEVMAQRNYVPADNSEQVAPMDQNPVQNLPIQQPAAQQQTPAPAVTYEPMQPMPSKPVTSIPAGTVSNAKATTYVVKAGDTVGRIARQHGVSVAAVMQANNLDEAKAKRLRIGQKLSIPGSNGAVIRTAGNSKVAGKAAAPKQGKPAAVATGTLNADGTYTVKSGDVIPTIARKLGVKASDLMSANNLDDAKSRRLQVGQKLVVPGKGTATAAVTPEVSKPATVTPAIDLTAELEKNAATTPVTTTPATTVPVVVEEVAPVIPATAEAAPIVVGESIPTEVVADTTVDEFAAKNKTTAAKLRELNPTEIPADGKLKAGQILFVAPAN